MTNEKKYPDNCPKCNKPMLRRIRDLKKECRQCLMSRIGFENAEKKRTNPKRLSQKQYTKNSFEKNPLKFRLSRTCSQAKIRSKKQNVPFNITRQDLINMFPADNLCPVLKVPFEWGTKINKDYSPSLDRMIPELGYVKGNIKFISYKANRIKNNATIAILENLIKYMKS